MPEELAPSITEQKGEITPCKMCKNSSLHPTKRLHCKWCLTHGYTAKCLTCDGTGRETAGAVWDGGKSKHSSTCNTCGGVGTIPARLGEYAAWVASHPAVAAEPVATA